MGSETWAATSFFLVACFVKLLPEKPEERLSFKARAVEQGIIWRKARRQDQAAYWRRNISQPGYWKRLSYKQDINTIIELKHRMESAKYC